jgi:hypothetical protein
MFLTELNAKLMNLIARCRSFDAGFASRSLNRVTAQARPGTEIVAICDNDDL